MSTPSSTGPEASPQDDIGFDALALVAGCVLPGLGHIVQGERVRGLCVGVGVLGLFGTGMLVGGIDVVDRREDAPYFVGQALVGPLAFAVDYVHQNHFKVVGQVRGPNNKMIPTLRSGFPGEMRTSDGKGVMPDAAGNLPAGTGPVTRPAVKSISKINELGMLFGAIAGMVNVIAVIDAGFPSRRRRQFVENLASKKVGAA
jgi:hypothetical protein